MSTDFQQARTALGVRLRELRLHRPGGRLTGEQLARQLGWHKSKVSKLENGKQTATPQDLTAWAQATGHEDAIEGLHSQLAGFESLTRSWRRQLAGGHRPVQETLLAEHERTHSFRLWENSAIPGVLQTPDYARAMFTRYTELRSVRPDIEEAVRARLELQKWIYAGTKEYHVVLWEAALYALICSPQTLALQLERLAGLVGLNTMRLGVVPLTASLKIPPGNGFWIYDDRLVVVEDWHAELWLDTTDSVTAYEKVWNTLTESAVYGPDAHRSILRARQTLGPS
ncbi:helix-turn-helix domain-containing protein [Streptomyces sp. NPDC058321]|uniref:helix-turn-helix domain-containing protein n=1 Tax=Streptomyces sp. NPDC058321 TaxID=3346445 RepID=UPI0036E29694